MTETVLLLGNGGREHAWALAIHKSGGQIINWSPKINPGIEDLSEDIIIESYSAKPDFSGKDIDLAIIGPEAPLVIGVSDWLEDQGIPVFGPSKENAKIEGSKSYMRQLLTKYEIDGNVDYTICRTEDEIEQAVNNNYEVAVKPDGLTGGKGVKVYADHLKDKGEVEEYARHLLAKDGVVLLEELLIGTEFTLQAFANGAQMIFLPLVADYKRAFEDDIGPNTGSMGAVSLPNHSIPILSDKDLEKAKSILTHITHSLSLENGAYKGAIYGQYMLTEDGPKIVEINARLGDPEAINVLELLDTPLLEMIENLMDEDKISDAKFSKDATCCVYLVPEGYPSDPEAGAEVNIEDINPDMVRYASVERKNGKVVTTTSRSLAFIGRGETLEKAIEQTYKNLPEIEGLRYRSDIGHNLIDS